MRRLPRGPGADEGAPSRAPSARLGLLASLVLHAAAVTVLAGTGVLHLRTEPRPAEFTGDCIISTALPDLPAPPPPSPLPPPPDPPEVLAEEVPDVESLPPRQDDLPVPAPLPGDPVVAVPDRPCWRERPPAPPPPPPRPPVPAAAPAPRPHAAPAAAVLPAGPSRRASPLPGNRPPVYPEAALAGQVQGAVLLLVHVARDGAVVRVEVARSSGFPVLDREAVRAVRTWRFQPALDRGRTVPAAVELPVRFVLP